MGSSPIVHPIEGHYCPEWDFAWIEVGDPEMEACICFMEGRQC